MLKPSDDPVRAARSLELQQSQSVNQQFLANIGYAKDQLALTDTRLSTMTDTLQYMRQQFIKAGNGGLSAQDKAAIASDLRSQRVVGADFSDTRCAVGERRAARAARQR